MPRRFLSAFISFAHRRPCPVLSCPACSGTAVILILLPTQQYPSFIPFVQSCPCWIQLPAATASEPSTVATSARRGARPRARDHQDEDPVPIRQGGRHDSFDGSDGVAGDDPVPGMPRLVPRRPADVEEGDDYDIDDDDYDINNMDDIDIGSSPTAQLLLSCGLGLGASQLLSLWEVPRLVPAWPKDGDDDDEKVGSSSPGVHLHVAVPGASRALDVIRFLSEHWPEIVMEDDESDGSDG